ncbi:chemotaxis-specific protein-glutamate methyltransferase CheB [Erythrobacter sp. Alg231-14]|uniref:chemotaxis-specific protein-glutamate methyltransferase CheB n=1 Tax=Erythrobacter sp. Alg231-14 TaxID=1922225 RepID=UPI00307C6160
MNAPTSSPSRLLRKANPLDETSTGQAGAAPVANRPADAIRVMLIDDSLTVRTVFKRMVESDAGMVVSQTASSAERGIAQLKDADIDVILLDLEMPGMGGLEALPMILKVAPEAQVMVVSSLTEDGAEATVQALSTGAADTMLKPRPGGFNEEYRSQLLSKIRALGGANDPAKSGAGSATPDDTRKQTDRQKRRTKRPDVLAIGASTGGIHALNVLMRKLTPDFDLPILITQHLPSSFIPVFARQIEVASGRPTHIAEDGTEIRRGEIAIATGHGHMVARRIGDRLVTRIKVEAVENGCMPSVDPMLSSLTEICEGRVLAIILSGMGRDGLEGAELLTAAGGTVWAQDAETSAVWGMPGSVAKAGLTSLVASPEELGAAIMDQFSLTGAVAQQPETQGAAR